MVDEFLQRFLADFLFADCRLGSHSTVSASAFWRAKDYLIRAESSSGNLAIRRMSLRIGGSLSGLAFRERKAVRWNAPQSDTAVYAPIPGLERVDSMLAVPMRDGEKTVGVLSLYSTSGATFAERDLDRATLLGTLLVCLKRHAKATRATPASRSACEALRQVRNSMSIPEVDLADILGVSQIELARSESGDQPPSRDAMYRWCRALGLLAATTAARVELVDISPSMLRLLEADPHQLSSLSPGEFERFVAGRLDRMGYDVTLSGSTTLRDGGIDLVAVPKVRTVASFLLAGQVKHHESQQRTGRSAVDRLLAWKDSPFRLAMLVTNTEFTKDALWLAELEAHRPFLRLRDFEALKRWLRNDFTSDHDWKEIPDSIEVAPGIVISVPRPRILDAQLISRGTPRFISNAPSVIAPSDVRLA